MDKIILNFKLLKNNNISINEFLCLLKVYFSEQGSDINYTDDLYHNYQSLELKKFIKIKIETVENEKRVKYILREKSKLLLEASFNDYDKVSITKVRNVSDKHIERLVSDRVMEYRLLFKPLKRGAMGSPEGCKAKLKRWLKNNPNYNFDDIIKAAKLYIQELNGDYRYLQQADYFIYKKVGRDEVSRLSTFVEELDNALIVDAGWTSQII